MTTPELRAWLETLAEARAVVPAEEILRRWPGEGSAPSTEPTGDLTLADVAGETRRAISTCRTWCNSGRLKGAYRLNNRDWRVPRAALRAFLDSQAGSGASPEPQDSSDVEWDDWRK